jgi:Ornithine/acetylornithine aminotransferase
VIAMTNSATSHLLPVFARADLGFERGEGAWLISTNGERYLDFTSGVAVNALGHCHPHLVAPCRSRRPNSGTCRTCSRARTATSSRAAVRAELCRFRVLL